MAAYVVKGMVIFEKELIVLSVMAVAELATGDPVSVVAFGEYVDKSRIVSRLSEEQKRLYGNRITATWTMLWIKTDKQIPYRVGSKWKVSVSEDGSVSLSELK